MKNFFIVALTLVLFSFAPASERPVHIFMIGDSTMANKKPEALPETGWGQVLPEFFNMDSVVIDNHAVNGRSSKSFLGENRWEPVISQVQAGDYVIIQFGHNDQKEDEARHTDPFTTYTENLLKYIKETRAKGGIPIICTSIVRRHFDEKGKLEDSHKDYLKAVKKIAKKEKVLFLDLEAKTREVVEDMGPDESKYLYVFVKPGVYPNRPEGKEDNTHLSQLGAHTVAKLAVDEMKELEIPFVKYLK